MSARKSCDPQDSYIEDVLNAFAYCSCSRQNHDQQVYLYINLNSGKVDITPFKNQGSELDNIHHFAKKFLSENTLSDEQLLSFYQSVVEINKEHSGWMARFIDRLKGKSALSSKIDEIFAEVHRECHSKLCCEKEACSDWVKKHYPQFSDQEIEEDEAHFIAICRFAARQSPLPTFDEIKFLLDLNRRNISVEKGWKILNLLEMYPMIPPTLPLIRLLSSMSSEGLEQLFHLREEFGSKWNTKKFSYLFSLIQQRSECENDEEEYALSNLEIRLLLTGKFEECSTDECHRIAKILFYCPLLEKAVDRIKQLPFVSQNKLLELAFRQNQSISAEEVNRIRYTFEHFIRGDSLREAMKKAELRETPFLSL